MDEKIEILEKLLKEHCCQSNCNCKKHHLYCGFELDHGIELQAVIDILKNKSGKKIKKL